MPRIAPARIMAAYPLFGDVDGRVWMIEVLKQAQADKKISAYSVGAVGLSVPTGVQTVDFSVVAEIDVQGSKADVKRRARDLVNGLVNDTDVIVQSVSVTTPV